MKISLIKFGRIKYEEIGVLTEHYAKRIKPFCPFENYAVKEDKKSIATASLALKTQFVISCDERGRLMDSLSFSKQLLTWIETYPKGIAFIVGGSYGHPPEVTSLAKEQIALAKMVLTSDLAYLMLMEQIYRAFNIANGTPYHH